MTKLLNKKTMIYSNNIITFAVKVKLIYEGLVYRIIKFYYK